MAAQVRATWSPNQSPLMVITWTDHMLQNWLAARPKDLTRFLAEKFSRNYVLVKSLLQQKGCTSYS